MFILAFSIDQEKTLTKVLNFDKINSCYFQAYEYFNPINGAVLYSLKLSIAILFLLLMRGGTPRYRYDYLTKLGWLKFLNFAVLTIMSLFSLVLLFYCNQLYLIFDHQLHRLIHTLKKKLKALFLTLDHNIQLLMVCSD